MFLACCLCCGCLQPGCGEMCIYDILLQMRAGTGWNYDANALEFSHLKNLHGHGRKHRPSLGTFKVMPICMNTTAGLLFLMASICLQDLVKLMLYNL